jgi:fermentation-respiration switch protein FrsA (DUF1100 family)
MNISLFAFDFCGSGKSDGEFISLGYYEKEDVLTVIEYLRNSNKVSTIGLWGRSMGAVTAILCAKELDYKYVISCVVSDSAFSSLSQLIDEFVEKVVSLPQFLINIMKKNVGDIIEKKANFRIEEIEPIKNLEKCNTIPILFCHGLDDTFINSHHCNDLYKKYGGKKEIVMFEGEHNEKRPLHILQIISLFFYNHLKVENIVEISLAYDKKNKETLSTLTSLYDEGEINSNINGIEEEMDITNDEEDRKRDVKSLSVKKSIVKNYFKAG